MLHVPAMALVPVAVTSCECPPWASLPGLREIPSAQLESTIAAHVLLSSCVLQDAEPGTRTHGIVTGVKEYGVFVALWGGLKGLAHSSELGLAPGQTPEDSFQEGQVSICDPQW